MNYDAGELPRSADKASDKLESLEDWAWFVGKRAGPEPKIPIIKKSY